MTPDPAPPQPVTRAAFGLPVTAIRSASPEPSSSTSSLAISPSKLHALLPKGPQETSASSSKALMAGMPRGPASPPATASGRTSESSSLYEVASRMSSAPSSGLLSPPSGGEASDASSSRAAFGSKERRGSRLAAPGSGSGEQPDQTPLQQLDAMLDVETDSPATSSPSGVSSGAEGYVSSGSGSAPMSIGNGSSPDVEMSRLSSPASGAGVAPMELSRPGSSGGPRPSEETPLALPPPAVPTATKATRPGLTRTKLGRDWISHTTGPFEDPNPSTRPEPAVSPPAPAPPMGRAPSSNVSSPTPTLATASRANPGLFGGGEDDGDGSATEPSVAGSCTSSPPPSLVPPQAQLMERAATFGGYPSLQATPARLAAPESIPLPASPATSSAIPPAPHAAPTPSSFPASAVVAPPGGGPFGPSSTNAAPPSAALPTMKMPTGSVGGLSRPGAPPFPSGLPMPAQPFAHSLTKSPSSPSPLSGLAGPSRSATTNSAASSGGGLLSQKRRNRPFSAGGPTGPMKLNLGSLTGGFGSPVDTPPPPGGAGVAGMSAEEAERWKAGLRTASLPKPGKGFFDNIRQDSESLSLTSLLSNLAPLELPQVAPAVRAQLPRFLSSLVDLSPLQRMERLAREFYAVEKSEQDRLHGVMAMHASDSTVVSVATSGGRDSYGGGSFGLAKAATGGGKDQHVQGGLRQGEYEKWRRFGISAGVELGEKNRYKNIWPFEHSRVRLRCRRPEVESDYINASNVSLGGSTKRYIASQAPLATTHADFWRMAWDEGVGVVVMLTLCREAGREKCGRYFEERVYEGEWDVRVLEGEKEECSVRAEKGKPGADSGGYFTLPAEAPAPSKIGDGDGVTFRTIGLRKRATGEERRIRHVQCTNWPDFDVPPNPREVVELTKAVDRAQEAYAAQAGPSAGPVLVHCSAGVGRTGSFIVIDSLLDVLRQQRHALARPPPRNPSPGLLAKKRLASRSLDLRLVGQPSTPTMDLDVDPFSNAVPGGQPGGPSADTPSLLKDEPILSAVEEMREQRMSMVANLRQYASVYEAVLAGVTAEIEQEGKAGGST